MQNAQKTPATQTQQSDLFRFLEQQNQQHRPRIFMHQGEWIVQAHSALLKVRVKGQDAQAAAFSYHHRAKAILCAIDFIFPAESEGESSNQIFQG